MEEEIPSRLPLEEAKEESPAYPPCSGRRPVSHGLRLLKLSRLPRLPKLLPLLLRLRVRVRG